MPTWTTTTKIIEALGGNAAVAKLTGRGYTAVCNWHHWPHFPPTLFLLMSQALLERGVSAPADLWGMERGPRLEKPRSKGRVRLRPIEVERREVA